MATVVGCAGGGGRLIAVGAQQAVPLVLSLSYAQEADTPTIVGAGFGGSDPFTTSFLNQNTSQNTGVREELIRLGVATSVQAQQSIAAQFQNALNDSIFVTPFGDLPGEVRIAFIANRKCNDFSDTSFDVIQHYLDRRLLPNKNKLPATVVVGSGAFRGYLIGLSIGANAQDTPIVQGTLVFKAWPK